MKGQRARIASRLLFAFAITAAMLAGFSCQNRQQWANLAWDKPAERLVWPQAPDTARVEWVGAICSAADIERAHGFGQGVAELLFGKQDSSMVKPVAVSKNRAGLLAVADPGVPTVHFFDLENKKYYRPKRKYAELLPSPVGVAVADDGLTYVADSITSEILVFDSRGGLARRFGAGILKRPTGVALNAAQDKIFIVDTLSNSMFSFDREGNQLRETGERGEGPGQFNFPTFIGAAPQDALCVSDSLNFRVQVVKEDGTPLRSIGQLGDGAGSFSRPKGVATDTSGHLYVVDAAFENIQVFDSEGALLLAIGGSGSGPGEFCLPAGLCIDSSNTIWVADSYNRRIAVFRLLENSAS